MWVFKCDGQTLEFSREFLADMHLPGGWPYKGPVLKFFELLCEEFLRWEEAKQYFELEVKRKMLRKYADGFVVMQVGGVFHPTRP